MPQLRVGCSGWNYTSWKGPFYPADLPSSEWLDYYTRRFDTVEVNNTFYRLPEESTFTAWRGETPAGFLMAIKASRFLTHMKRLRDPDEPLDRLFSRVAALGPRLGPVLYQLPGNFPSDHKRLEAFLDALPVRLTPRGPRLQHVIEFRHPSWYTRDTFEMLEDHGVALCLHDMVGSAISEERVGPLCYVRFHGASGRYRGSYDNATLSRWARRLAARWRAGADTYIYFNNDTNAMAPRNANNRQRRPS